MLHNSEQFESASSKAPEQNARPLFMEAFQPPQGKFAAQTDESDSLDLFGSIGDKGLRGFGAAHTLYSNGLSGFLREGANMQDLAHLKNVNPQNWGYTSESALGSVRYQLQQNKAAGSYRLLGEDHTLEKIGARGAVKGVAIGAGALVGSMAVDALLFPETPRTWVSQLVDIGVMPAIGYIPMNPYLKGAAMIGAHTLGRVYDHYYGKPNDY